MQRATHQKRCYNSLNQDEFWKCLFVAGLCQSHLCGRFLVQYFCYRGPKMSHKDLGVSDKPLCAWVTRFKSEAEFWFADSTNLRPANHKLRQLREENRVLRMEWDLLQDSIHGFTEVNFQAIEANRFLHSVGFSNFLTSAHNSSS